MRYEAGISALILGNVNVGKTTLFNRVCRRNQKVANYPGTTVAIGRGVLSEGGVRYNLIDTPGIDDMTPDNEDEKISLNILLEEDPEMVVLVAGGRNLRKSLLLMLQLAEYAKPVLLNINMMDEARQWGIRIDRKNLSEILGVPVTWTVATEGEGIGSFRESLAGAAIPGITVSYPEAVESALATITSLLAGSGLPARAVGTALLAGDREIMRLVASRCDNGIVRRIEQTIAAAGSEFSRSLDAVILAARLRAVDRIISETQSILPPAHVPFSEKLGEWARRPLTGIPIAVLVIIAMYLFVGKLGAQFLVGLLEGRLFGEWIIPATEELLSVIPSEFISEAFVGEFGLVSVGFTLAVGVVLPVLATFFLAFGCLEDSGYLPRLSILLDRLLRRIGLNGKGILPLVLGFSCITMAILTTRILETRRERFIATMLLILGLPCAPLLAVMLVLLGGMSPWASVVVFGVILTQIILVGYVLSRMLPGGNSDFILELPPIRVPGIWNLLKKTGWRMWWFSKEALPLFLTATFIMFLLDRAGALNLLQSAGKPVVTGILGLPSESIQVMIMTLIRRESGAALLKQFSDAGLFDNVQVVVTLLVLTFLSPCVNAVLVMLKERGTRDTLAIMAFVTPYAVLVGAAVNLVCRTFGVTF